MPYSQDPAIFGWELGNELFSPPCSILEAPICCPERGLEPDSSECNALDTLAPVPSAWTREMARFIKALDPNHLVIDGGFPVPQECDEKDPACLQARPPPPLRRGRPRFVRSPGAAPRLSGAHPGV